MTEAVALQDFADGGENLAAGVGEGAGHADASGAGVATTFEALGEFTAVH